jgi:murein L,D-transpeptidase YafK
MWSFNFSMRFFILIFALLMILSTGYAQSLEKANKVVIEKSARTLTLYSDSRVIAAFKIALGRSPIGEKECDGDNKTPEGVFRVTEHKANSAYHRALRLSYPEASNTMAAAAKGCKPGSDIMIHGIRNGFGWVGRWHRLFDWTRGCVALTNEEIEKVWELVSDSTIVEIKA